MIRFAILLLFAATANAQLSVNWEKEKIPVTDIYAEANLPAKATPLMKLKWSEIHADWQACHALANGLLSQKLPIQGWVLVTQLKCARKEMEIGRKRNSVTTILEQTFKTRSMTEDGTWTAHYRQEYNKFFTSTVRLAKITPAEAHKFLRQLSDLTDDNIKVVWATVYPESKKTKKDPDLSGAAPLKKLEANELFSAYSEAARNSHKKLAFQESLTSAISALKYNTQDVTMLFIAGRSAFFLGRYEEAKKYFITLSELGLDTPEAEEATFRLGLLHYRLGNYQLAIPAFEALIQKHSEKYELNSWYWLYRSLQGTKSGKAESVRSQIVAKYPFSYYGLKLFNSLKDMPREEFTPEVKNIELYGDFTDSYNRVKTLLKNGWLIEAQLETSSWPVIPESGWGLWLAKHRQWPAAIRVANRVIDDELAPRTWSLMQEFYPLDYYSLAKTVGANYNMDPVLILSLIRQESAFGIKAFSTSSAMGLMQMIPPTAADLARRMKLKIDLEEEIFLPPNNMPMGSYYLSSLIDDYGGHIPLALASYNAGPYKIKAWMASRTETADPKTYKSTDVKDEIWMDELPFYETSFYVKAILRNVILYKLKLDPNYELQPNFWLDMWQKK